MNTAKRKTRCRRGAAMVEMALILPLLLLLTFGVMEYGWAFLRVSQVNNAARQGVRVAVRPAADEAEVLNSVAQVMTRAGIGDENYEVSITGLEAAVSEPVTVLVTLSYPPISLGGGFVPMPSEIKGTATMAKEGS